MQHPIPWISDTNSALLHAQFEKSQTKRTTFLWKKAVPLMKVLLILKIGRGKVTNFSEVTKFFPDEKVVYYSFHLNVLFSNTKILKYD